MKKLRSNLPQRKRSQFSPVLRTYPAPMISDSHLTSQVDVEASCDSSRVSANEPKTTSLKKRGLEGGAGDETFRRITRSYYSKQREKEKEKENFVPELSEPSCVESCSGLAVRAEARSSKDSKETITTSEASDGLSRSQTSCVQQLSDGVTRKIGGNVTGDQNLVQFNEKEAVSVTSGSTCSYTGKISVTLIRNGENGVTGDDKVSEVSRNCAESDLTISSEFPDQICKSGVENKNRLQIKKNAVVSVTSALDSPSKTKSESICSHIVKNRECDDVSEVSRSCAESTRIPRLEAAEFDLACSESLTCEDDSEYSSAYTELQSEVFPQSSDLDLSDYTPSIWYESGSQFSVRSVEDDSSPSPTYQLFVEFGKQFCRSTSGLRTSGCLGGEEQWSGGANAVSFSLLIMAKRMEDEEDEESYQMTRTRERRQVYVHDYAEEYSSTTGYGNLVIQQRLQMVHWMIEQQSNGKEFQRETLFLGVSLLDRFLSKGYFKNKRNLQIAGIACLALAIRIEENQPFNRYYLKAARADDKMENTAKYLAVLAVQGHEQLRYWPSTVAAGLVILASLSANQGASWHQVAETHARTKDDADLSECIQHACSYLTEPGVVSTVHMLARIEHGHLLSAIVKT
ncbi:hypothetical protein RJ639_024346 [Escallonia herrerae]|uniref:Cyclin N-terminal domain-containing protein n=1 Tax=Escallonia herrerae TaxID=1293975 RepID=A0AA88UZG1_9ASTE|nr:hypothetical protein RJ639_024346 [Escallonia herrerae]